MGYLQLCGASFTIVFIAGSRKHHCCVISHGATLGPDDVTGQGDLAGWLYLYYRALVCVGLCGMVLCVGVGNAIERGVAGRSVYISMKIY